MGKLWTLKFLSLMPNNPIQLYFIDEAIARHYYTEYTRLLRQKPDDECEVLDCEDMLGNHAIRPSIFPYCFLFEVAAAEATWKGIDDRIKAVKAEVGKINQVGFIA